jgi:hypothetical protein
MKELGIVINCCERELYLASEEFLKKYRDCEIMEVCMVYSDNSKPSLRLLSQLQRYCKSISTVKINKNKSETYALRAGVRYIIGNFNLPVIAVVTGIEQYALDQVLEALAGLKDTILEEGLRPHDGRFIMNVRDRRIVQIMPQDLGLKRTA